MKIADLAHVNAALNASATVLLFTGHRLIHHKRVTAHKLCMIAATLVSTAFLTCYVIYHLHVGSVKFAGQGISRPIYFAILISHVLLAATLPVLVSMTLYRALRSQFDRHKRIARWTYPIWLYVSITGVVVYLMLYHLFAART